MDLLGKLVTHEIHLKEDEEETQPKKGVAFKTISEEHHSSEDESNEEDKDSRAMNTRGLKKILSQRDSIPRISTKGIFLEEDSEVFKSNKPLNNKNESGSLFSLRFTGACGERLSYFANKVEQHK